MVEKRGLLLGLMINIPLILLFGWSLSDTIQVTIQVKGDICIANVGGYPLSITDPRYPVGKVGLYLEDSHSSPLWMLMGRLARGEITVTDLETDHRLLCQGWNSRWKTPQPGSGVLILLGDEGWRDYRVQAKLPQHWKRIGVLVRASDQGSGYLFWLRPKHESMGWELWKESRPLESLAIGRFRQSFSSALKACLRRILGSYLGGLGILLACRVTCPALAVFPSWRKLQTKLRGSPLKGFLRLRVRVWPQVAAVLISLAGTGVAALIATELLGRIPHVQDSVAYLFQAKTFALGRISVPSPPLPEFFEHEFILNRNGMWFGKYPPGHPLVLALGVLTGFPWLVGPIVGGLSLFLIYRLGEKLYNPHIGLLAAALGFSSPFFLFMSGSFMSHPTCLLFILLFQLCCLNTQRSGRWWWPLLGGLAIGWAFITREFTAFCVAFPFIAYAIWQLRSDLRRLAPRYALMALGALGPCLFLLWYNRSLTGNPLLNPHELWWSFDRLGFGPDKGPQGHTPARGLINTERNLALLQAHLFGWPPYLSLALPLLPFIAFRASHWDWLLLSSFISLVIGHLFYWADGIMFGPRYYYEALPALLLLTARGIATLAEIGRRKGYRRSPFLPTHISVACLVIALISYNLACYLPEQWKIYKGYNYVDTRAIDAVKRAGVHNAVVFVEHRPKWQWWKYGCVFSSNSPLLDSDVVYARDLGDARNKQLISVFPDRRFYRLKGEELIPLDYSKPAQ